ncbi:hypothetical protein BJ166DRAFT_589917 [Pestalotiopsis sp. NC0098]|nr:hypothetical protein BJ166DRAFT_589917 [Pestalotiopsis sp. NC0098]
MRWDGAARSSIPWDCLKKDPELWHKAGDCYVHLCGQGQSRRGPAFNVSFATLQEANCQPLLDRFMSNESKMAVSAAPKSRRGSKPSDRLPRVELYIPAPPNSDKQQAYSYHLATRNFFAFVFRRSLVGEHLGEALINLMHSMRESRAANVDNEADLLSYMDEEGYLDMKNRPTYALANLRFAEAFQIRDLYIEAFAHCCGMNQRLHSFPEYQLLSSVTKKLMRRAVTETEVKLGQIGKMLSTFLQDELSEAYLGLSPGARAHMERFRTLLQGFYAAKLGYYPPRSIHTRTTIFEASVYRRLRDDFEALYQYLVDENFEPSAGVLPSAQGGICALQSVQSFDMRCKYSTLKNPLPLLPNISLATSRRMSWFGKQPKLTVRERVESHIALMKATNEGKMHLLNNDLVRTYRKFEEDSIFAPIKGDKQEQISLTDARKVRWILVYTMYQTLLQATRTPDEVKDSDRAPYSLCIATGNLPPWDHPIPSFIWRQSDLVSRNPSVSTASQSELSDGQRTPDLPMLEIKPDIDYLGLINQDVEAYVESEMRSPVAETPPRRKGLSRNNTFRKSMRVFGGCRDDKTPTASSSRRQSQQHHEISLSGYGNPMQELESIMAAHMQTTATTSRSASTASQASSTYASEDGSASTADTSCMGSCTNSPVKASRAYPWELSRSGTVGLSGRDKDEATALPRTMSMGSTSRPLSAFFEPRGSQSRPSRHRTHMAPPPKGRFDMHKHNLSKISSSDEILEDIKTFSELHASQLASENIVWDSYNDLGGLREVEPAPPRRVSTIF